MPRLLPTTSVLLAAAIVTPSAAAQTPPDTFRLGEMVVTATRLPLPAAAVPASVTVLDGAALRTAGIRFVSQALRSVPGVSIVQSGSTGGLTSVFMRGGESDYVRVMIDGVPINDPGGAVDLAHITTDDVERVEIVRGPTSVLYGTDAASGVIQVFTRRGMAASRVTGSFGLGSEARVGPQAAGRSPSWDASAGAAGRAGTLGYALTASRHSTDGAYAFNNNYDNTTIGGRLDIGGDRTAAALTARWSDGTFHFPTNGGGAIVDANQYRASESFVLGLAASHTLSPHVAANLSVTSRSGAYRIDDRPDSPADTLGSFAQLVTDDVDRAGADAWFDLRPSDALTLTLGGVVEWQSAKNETLSESSFGIFESASDNDRRNTAVYGQAVLASGAHLTLTAGARIDENDRFGAFRTYRVGANWHAASGLRLRASGGTGFKEPTFFENFATGFVTGNPSLEPERTRSFDAGIEQAFLDGRLTIGATAWAQRFRNLIMFTFEPPAGQESNYFNVGAAESNGVELSVRWNPATGVTAGASWDWLDTRVTDDGFGGDRTFIQGRRLLRRPAHSASVDVGYATPRWNVSFAIDRTGDRDDLDFSDPIEFSGIRVGLDAVTTVDFAAQMNVLGTAAGGGLDVVVRADNLLDARYHEIANFPAPRRSLRIGLRGRIDP
jgi:vitamin B12 transporter